MNTPIRDAIHRALFDLRGTQPSKARMHVGVLNALDSEGMTITSVIVVKRPPQADLDLLFNQPPRTLAGMPIIFDLSLSEDVIIFEDANGKELSRITDLPVAVPYDDELA